MESEVRYDHLEIYIETASIRIAKAKVEAFRAERMLNEGNASSTPPFSPPPLSHNPIIPRS